MWFGRGWMVWWHGWLRMVPLLAYVCCCEKNKCCLCACSVVSCFRHCHQSHDISYVVAILLRLQICVQSKIPWYISKLSCFNVAVPVQRVNCSEANLPTANMLLDFKTTTSHQLLQSQHERTTFASQSNNFHPSCPKAWNSEGALGGGGGRVTRQCEGGLPS